MMNTTAKIIIFILIIILLTGGGVYSYYRFVWIKKKDDEYKETLKKISNNVGLLGIWVNDTPSTLEDAIKYATNQGAKLATKDQLIRAQKMGFEYCKPGWLDTGLAGWVMSTKKDSCGEIGFNNKVPQSNEKLVIYCYGKIPDSRTVTTSIETN